MSHTGPSYRGQATRWQQVRDSRDMGAAIAKVEARTRRRRGFVKAALLDLLAPFLVSFTLGASASAVVSPARCASCAATPAAHASVTR